MPKTIRNVYNKNLTYEKLLKAHLDARKGKGSRKEIILFNLKQEEYIKYLLEKLKNKTYKHGGYTVFYVTEPKLRKIEKSKYMDRIVHRWLVDNILKPYFIPRFIQTTYACIEGRGMHKACLDIQKMMKHCTRIWNNYYILKMDIAKYFDNINKKILLNILEKRIKDKDVMWLINEILYIQALENIKRFLKENLHLELNSKTQIFKSSQGVNYCGYKINEYRLKIKDKGKKKLKKKIKYLRYEIKNGRMTSKDAKRYLAGHLGYLKIANTRNLELKIFEE